MSDIRGLLFFITSPASSPPSPALFPSLTVSSTISPLSSIRLIFARKSPFIRIRMPSGVTSSTTSSPPLRRLSRFFRIHFCSSPISALRALTKISMLSRTFMTFLLRFSFIISAAFSAYLIPFPPFPK